MSQQPILVAAHPASTQRLQKALTGHELVFVETLDQARERLERGRFSCVILGVQFDDSRTLKLLEDLSTQKRHLATPVVCVIGIRGHLSDVAIDAFDTAARALGARAVLDMTEFPDDERGNGGLRGLLDQFMPAFRASSPHRDS
jgi:DNA-binding NtrC family response regulator